MSGEAAAGSRENHDPLARVLDLRLPGDPSAIGAATDTISETLLKLDVPEEKRMEVALAVQEALAMPIVLALWPRRYESSAGQRTSKTARRRFPHHAMQAPFRDP
jgi:hypothetical protein